VRNKEVRKRFDKACRDGFSLGAEDYILYSDGKRRGSYRERLFRKKYYFDLLESYDHKCALCRKDKNKLELDHFFIPKSQYGDLMIRHKEGYWVCNAILLCRSCNKKKANILPKQFFTHEKLTEILEINLKINKLINNIKQ
jgi:5-methylcytosine-specific restriction endonuclease McrA